MDLQRLSRSRTEVRVPADTEVWDLSSDEAAAAIETLNAETAREILATLYEGPSTASEIATATDNSLQNVNYHLGNLREANLIEIADTRYSSKGTEMKIYRPRRNAVLLLSRPSTAERIKDLVSRLVLGIAVVGIGAIAFRTIALAIGLNPVERSGDDVATTEAAGGTDGALQPSMDAVSTTEQLPLLLDPGVVFFLAGLLVLLTILLFRWRRFTRPP